jgi:hypothetical protein
MVLIDIPFKGCQGRSNRSSIVHGVSYFACTMHAVSMRPHAPCMRYQWYRLHTCMQCQWYCMNRACGINDTACTMHAVSMTPHAFKKIRISSRIRIYLRKGFSPLNRSPGRMFWWKKNRGSKISWHCPLNADFWQLPFITVYINCINLLNVASNKYIKN